MNIRILLLALLSFASPSYGQGFLTQSACYISGSSTVCPKLINLASGGTNANLTAANGGLCYSDASKLQLTAAGTAQQWVLSGGAGAPTMSNTTTTGKMIDGSADEVQLTVQGHSTQTSKSFVVENSSGTDQVTISNTGVIETVGGVKFNAGAGTLNHYCSGSGTVTFGDVSGTVTDTWYWERIGNISIIMTTTNKTFTKNGSSGTVGITGLGSCVLPTQDTYCTPVPFIYNSVQATGGANIWLTTSGVTLYRSAAEDTFGANVANNTFIRTTFTCVYR